MSRCFGTPSNLSAKDYIYKKRNLEVFCDLRNKYRNRWLPVGTQTACVNKSGIITKYNSHTTMLNFDDAINTWRVDLSQNYTGQLYKTGNIDCPEYYASSNNTDISNNYNTNAIQLTTAASGSTAQEFVVDSSGQYINRYAEIASTTGYSLDGDKFKSEKQILYTHCPIRTSTRHQVILASEIPAPLVGSITIIFV